MEYDYIVIGAGAGGCALVSKLCKDDSHSPPNHHSKNNNNVNCSRKKHILLLEMGSEKIDERTKNPHDWAEAAFRSVNTNTKEYITVRQKHGNRKVCVMRGSGKGGSTLINALIYSRGFKSDYQNFPQDKWSIDEITESFENIENELSLEHLHTSEKLGLAYSNAAKDLSLNTLDLSTTNQNKSMMWEKENSYTPLRYTSRNGERVTAYDAFISPLLTHRGNDDTEVDDEVKYIKDGESNFVFHQEFCKKVKRIIFERSKNGEIITKGVIADTNCMVEKRYMLFSDERFQGEVILSCGVFESPKLLMLSGIGDAKDLKEFDIPIVKHLPEVGKNFHDHILIPVINISKKRIKLDECAPNSVHGWINYSHKENDNDGTSRLQILCTDGWIAPDIAPEAACTRGRGPIWNFVRDFFSLLLYFLLKIFCLRWFVRQSCNFLVTVVNPASRGYVRLTSKDTNAPLEIDPKYLTNNRDIEGLRKGIEISQNLSKTLALSGWILFELLPGFLFQYGKNLSSYLGFFCGSYFHPCGTCQMGTDELNSVVDSKLRIHGIQGLRIADASVLKASPCAGLQGVCMMIGDRLGRILNEDYKIKTSNKSLI